MNRLNRKYIFLIFIFTITMILIGCNNTKKDEDKIIIEDNNAKNKINKDIIENKYDERTLKDIQLKNIEKISKVWGYVKYRHPAFLLGKKDWDMEYIDLISKIYYLEDESEINNILLNWYKDLGEIDYGIVSRYPLWELATEENKKIQADASWINDIDYLGEELSSAFIDIYEIPLIDRDKAPVQFNSSDKPRFGNEKANINGKFDYNDNRHRLLGLSSVWNVIEYYFPYLDTLDENWSALFIEFIPKMIVDKDKNSYDEIIMELMARNKDAHTNYIIPKNDINQEKYVLDFYLDPFIYNKFGKYMAPAILTKAEGRLVIKEIVYEDCPLEIGDIIIKLDNEKIEDVIEERKKYIAIPNDEKILKKIGENLLSSHNSMMDITVLRDNSEMTLKVKGYEDDFISTPIKSYEILDGNIGLLNPAKLPNDLLHKAMEDLKDTDGLIIDLRQYPAGLFSSNIIKYLFEDIARNANFTIPSKVIPGVFLFDEENNYIRFETLNLEKYNKQVVILIDENSMSQAETVSMVFKVNDNVTAIGENTIGGNGDITFFQILGGKTIIFSSLGVYDINREQTQRIGVKPDIYVERTIKAVKEGRDEFIEAAIKFLINDN